MHKYFHLASVSLLFSFWKAVVSSEIGIKESKRGCMVNCSIQVCVLRASQRENKTKFIELPLDELEQKYDPEWLKEKVVNCQLPNFCMYHVTPLLPKNR